MRVDVSDTPGTYVPATDREDWDAKFITSAALISPSHPPAWSSRSISPTPGRPRTRKASLLFLTDQPG